MRMKTGAYFEGNVNDLANTLPFAINGRFGREAGHAFALDQHGIVRLFDHVLLRDSKTISVPFMMILGEIGSGKTTLATKIAQAIFPQAVRGGQRARIGVDTTKRSADEPEYERFVNFLGAQRIDLAAEYKKGINILVRDLGLSEDEHVKNLRKLAEYDDRPLGSREKHLLRVGVSKLFNDYKEPHLRILNDLFVTMTKEQFDQEIWRMRTNSEGIPSRMSQHEIDSAAMELNHRFSGILNGEAGTILGGEASLADAMSQNVVSFDYTGLDPESIPLTQSLIWRVKTSALRRGDDRFICDVEIHDENYDAWQHMVYASAMHGHVKKLRGRGSLLIMVTHRIGDYLSIGGDQGELAANMLNDVGMVAIGRHNPDQIPALQERFGISDTMGRAITVFQPGTFCMKLGKEEPFIAKVRLTELERKMNDTDAATRRNLQRSKA